MVKLNKTITILKPTPSLLWVTPHPNNSSQLVKQKTRYFLPKGESGREAMKWHISYHNETIINENDELKNKFSYQPYHLL